MCCLYVSFCVELHGALVENTILYKVAISAMGLL